MAKRSYAGGWLCCKRQGSCRTIYFSFFFFLKYHCCYYYLMQVLLSIQAMRCVIRCRTSCIMTSPVLGRSLSLPPALPKGARHSPDKEGCAIYLPQAAWGCSLQVDMTALLWIDLACCYIIAAPVPPSSPCSPPGG